MFPAFALIMLYTVQFTDFFHSRWPFHSLSSSVSSWKKPSDCANETWSTLCSDWKVMDARAGLRNQVAWSVLVGFCQWTDWGKLHTSYQQAMSFQFNETQRLWCPTALYISRLDYNRWGCRLLHDSRRDWSLDCLVEVKETKSAKLLRSFPCQVQFNEAYFPHTIDFQPIFSSRHQCNLQCTVHAPSAGPHLVHKKMWHGTTICWYQNQERADQAGVLLYRRLIL